jgi:hypothetical protein
MFHSCQLWHPPKDWEFFFSHESFGVETYSCCLHMWKNSSPKDPQKNDIPNLPTGAVVRNKGENCSNFDSLPTRVENMLFQHETFVTWSLWCWSHVWKFSRPKDTHKNSYSSILGKRFSPLFLTTTLVGRFGMSLSFCRSFGLEFFHV